MFKKELYQEKYRIKSTRLQNWDYSNSGYYFIIICTKDKIEYFGKINNGIMYLNKLGFIVKKCLFDIPRHFPHTFLDCDIIMPNHVHVIVGIKNLKCRDAKFCVSTGNIFGPQSKNIPSIIRGFKVGVKKYTTINNINFQWQKSYYDHIVRDEDDLNRIRNYIQNNTINWSRDINNN
jgi:putative transposase